MTAPIPPCCIILERLGPDGWYALDRHLPWDSTRVAWLGATDHLDISDPEREWIEKSLSSGHAIGERGELRYLVMIDTNPATLSQLLEFCRLHSSYTITLDCSPLVTITDDQNGSMAVIRPDCMSQIVRGEIDLASLEWAKIDDE